MKTPTALFCGIIMLFTVASVNAKPHATIKKHRPGTCNVTFTSIHVTMPLAGYHVVISNSAHRYTAGPGSTTPIAQGTYSVVVIPTGGAGSTHNYHINSCSQILNTSGTSGTFSNVDFNCASGSISLN